MQSLDSTTNQGNDLEASAELVMETVTLVKRAIRCEMRAHRPAGLSMQQFRALGVVRRCPGTSLALVADRLGLTAASASRLVESLAKAGFVSRVDSPHDRRRVELRVTEGGVQALEAARSAALGKLARMLAELDETDRSRVESAMHTLRAMFDTGERTQL